MSPTKFISSNEIISKLYRDLGSQTTFSDIDVGEWIFDILDDLKLPIVHIPKLFNNEGNDYENYQIKLPDDFVKLRWVIVDGCPATLSMGDGIHLLGNPCYTQSAVTQWDTISGSPWFIDGFGDTFGPVSGTSSLTNCSTTFIIVGNFLKFNKSSGSVVLLYDAFPIDEDGFPMIPDVKEIKDAITKYVIMKIDYISWRSDPKDQGKGALYKDSQREYFWAVGKAQSAIKLPDLHEMEQIKREHLRLIPNTNRYKQLFNLYGKNKWNI